jgi:hypothetical protein
VGPTRGGSGKATAQRARARRERWGAVEGRLGRTRVGEGRGGWAAPAGPRRGGRREGGGERGREAAAGPRAKGGWLGHKERGRDFPFFIFLFSTKFHPKILFSKSLNHKQTKHGPA